MTLALIIYLVFTALPAISNVTLVAFSIWVACSATGLFIGAFHRDVYGNRDVWMVL